MNEPENKAQPRWMQGRPIDSSKPRWMQGKPVGDTVLAPSSNAGGVPVAPTPLPAATAPAGPATAQAVASAPVIPSAQASPVAAAPLPQAQPAAPPSPRFGQPGYNPLLHGGDSKPPLDLRINRALGIKDYRDEGPPTMSEVRARQSAPASQAQAQVNPVIEPGVVTPIDDRSLLQRMVRPPTDNEIMYGSRDEQHARVRRELGLPPLTKESEDRVSAVIDAVPGEKKEGSFGDAMVRGAGSAARSMRVAPSKVLETASAAGRGVLEFLLTPSAATGDFEAMMDAAAKASGVDPESTFSRQLKHELGKQSWAEERYQQKLEKLLADEFEKNGVAGKNGVLIAHGIVGLVTRLAMIKAATGLLPGQTGGASGSTWVESWANSAVKTASHASRTALFTYATQPGTHEERQQRAITTYFYMMTPMWSVGIPSNFITPIFDIGSNFWISNQLGVYDGAIEQAKAEHGDEWKLNLWRHLTPEMVLDGATDIAFGMLTRSATAEFLNAKVSPYINEVARELKKHGSTEPLIIDLQTKMDVALKQAETARASGDRNAVDIALETYQFLRSAHESLVSDATRQSAPASAPEDRMDYSGIRPEQDDLDTTRAAAAEALGTPRIGTEAQMEAERGAVPVSGDAWRQMAGVEAPSSAARVNPLLEPERVAQATAQAERPAEPQAEVPRPAEQVAAPEAARPPIEQARDEAGAPRQAPPTEPTRDSAPLASRYTPEQLAEMKAEQEKRVGEMGEKPAPRTAADLAKPAQEPARVAEPAQEPAMEKPTAPLAKAVAEAPQAFRVTSSRGNVHNVKMPDGTTYPIRAESKAEAVAKAQEIAAKAKPLSEMNDADLRERADELGVPYDPKSTAKELRARIRAAQQGGFIDVSPRAPSKDDPPFVRQMKENDRRVHEWQKRHTRDAISALRSEVVDRQADVKRALKGIGANDAIRRLVLRQGSGAEAARQFRVAEKSIADVLPTRDRELFKYYLQAMRVVEATQVQAERGIELKSPMSAEDAKRFLNDDFVKLPQEQQDAVMGAAKKYWGVMREQLDALYAEGLIGKEGYEAIATKHRFYSPRRFVEFIDPQTIKPKGEMRHDSGVDALDKGSESAMAADPMYLMAHVITRTQNRLFRNRANKALYDTAIASPENSVARVLGEKENPNRTEGSVSVFIDGKEVRMAMPKELAAEWDGLPPALSRNMAAFLQWASGTKVLKTLATGANPEFAISNLPRDAMYAWFISGQYSSVLPKAIGQILLDYKRSMRDARKRTGAYTDYVKEGGGMDFLTTQGMTRKPGIEGGHRLARKIGDILAWAGETSEIATRLAVRNRAIRNGLSPEEATYVARNMLDFSQGGTFAKAADNVIPYLNAAIQGTRGGFRAFKENPKVASFKAAQLAAMGYALAQVAATFTPELWDSINAREKASKWIIPLSWTRKDKEGNDRHAYIAIPKDQFQQVFAAIGQSFVDGVRGNPWKPQIVDSLFSTIPVEASSTIPPIMNAALAYYGNYDTWTKENVWQGYEDISPSKEQSWQTPEIAVDIAELASRIGVEISPERLATATGKVVPTSNPLGSIMSSIYATGNPDPELGRTIVEKLRDIPGIRRVLRFSRPSNLQKFTMDKAYQYNVDVAGMTDLQAREAIKVAERKRADVRYPLNIEADKIARQAVRGDVSSDNLQKWIDSVPQEERKRVESRIKAQYKKSWKSPSEIIRVITDPGATSDLSKQANAEWLAKYGMDGMTAKDLRTALVKEAREQGWNREMYDSKGKLTAYGQRKLRLSRFIRKHNIE